VWGDVSRRETKEVVLFLPLLQILPISGKKIYKKTIAKGTLVPFPRAFRVSKVTFTPVKFS